MNLIQGFENQKIEGITEKPEKIIETQLSKLFLYADKVYKIYKYDKSFMGDYSSFDFRKELYEEDFSWNHTMSLEIYLDLKNVKFEHGFFLDTNKDKAQDFYIEMKRIDNTKTLPNLLLLNRVSEKDIENLGHEMSKRILKLHQEKKHKLKHIFEISLLDNWLKTFEYARHYGYSQPEYVSKKETDEIIEKLIQTIKNLDYFKNFDNANLIVCPDNNCDNILLIDGKVGFLDVYPPVEIYRVKDPSHNISRLCVEIEALKNKAYSDILYKVCSQYFYMGTEIVRTIQEIFYGFYKGAYYYEIKRPELAFKFLKLIREKMKVLV